QQLPPVQTTAGASGNGFFFEQGQIAAPDPVTQPDTATQQACPQLAGSVLPPPQLVNGCFAELSRQVADARGNALNQLLIESGVALGIMAIASVGLGWLMAGRVLRPLRTMTATARRISARSLHQRIAITGPGDELKELGDTFDALLERLEASFRAQRQFVANASHELRTPLARQRTVLEVALRDRRASADSLAVACERALAASEQQEQLIAAMLTLAHGERGLDQFIPVDLAAITEEIALTREPEAATRNLTVDTTTDPALALGDPSLAERLVSNLIDNAIRHNVADGRIAIATGTTEDGRPFLTVSNTGRLIPAEQLPRLLQPFQRLDQARIASSDPAPGTGLGLGLAIVAAIAAAHQADLVARPNPTGGLTVEITFRPLSPGHTAAATRVPALA
ncbi:MAG TPA: ATP-binding protein, partial [Streptosporangiaceae bacterium]|nr:ATP-binding protein [Streptosporangiaceae bacterium]